MSEDIFVYDDNYKDVPPLRETNYVATGYIDLGGEKLDVRRLALHNFGIVHTIHKFSSGIQNLKFPRVASSMYKGGRLSIMAGDSPSATWLAMTKTVWILRRMGMTGARLTEHGIRINNVVCSAHIREGVDLVRLKELWPAAVTYTRKRFNGALLDTSVLGIKDTFIVMQVYMSGKINIVGSRTLEESCRVFATVKRNVFDKVRPDVVPQRAPQMKKRRVDDDDVDRAVFALNNTIEK